MGPEHLWLWATRPYPILVDDELDPRLRAQIAGCRAATGVEVPQGALIIMLVTRRGPGRKYRSPEARGTRHESRWALGPGCRRFWFTNKVFRLGGAVSLAPSYPC